MSESLAHKDAPDEVWLQIGYGDEGTHTWAAHQVAEDDIEQAGPYVRADRLSGRVTVSEEATAWQPIESAPRDGRWIWLWNKHCEDKSLAPQAYRWSTHYSVFGLGGCWTDGFATMGDKIDFDFWCEVLPANFADPYADEAVITGGDDDAA